MLPLAPPFAPMLAALARELPLGPYVYEPKWDGFRCMVFADDRGVDLRSRHGKPLARYFPEVVAPLRALPARSCVLDGELLIETEEGADFGALLDRTHPAASRVAKLAATNPATLVAFDLLALDGAVLIDAPFAQRRARLEALLAAAPPRLRATEATEDAELAARWLRERTGRGIDGVVAKRKDLRYIPGKRAMIKVKPERTADCVVGGMRLRTARAVGSLLLGLWDGDLLRHVGVCSQLRDAHRTEFFDELASDVAPLVGHPWEHGFHVGRSPVGRLPGLAGRWVPDEMELDWVPLRPERVLEVAYDHLDGQRFRHPARFVRWRPDRDAFLHVPRAIVITVDVGGHRVSITTPDRVLWPRVGWKKRDLVAYARVIAPTILPYLARRAVTLGRYPEGVDGPGFYQTRCPPGAPPWVRTFDFVSPANKPLSMLLVEDEATLVWTANLATIELHPLLHPVDHPDVPHALVLDLDPGPPATLLDAARAALDLHVRLEQLGLASYPKTSGKKGVHVYVPIPGATYRETKALARSLSRELASHDPSRFTDRLRRHERTGRVLVDWGQNDAMKSTVAPYSLRATSIPLVSTPVTWAEIEDAVHRASPVSLVFDPRAVLDRLERHGDLFASVIAPTVRPS